MVDYNLELDRVVSEVKSAKAKTVGLQFPEGLKDRAVEVAEKIESETGALAVIFVDPTYGGCDLKEDQCAKLGVDLLIHFGHTEFKR